MCPDSQGLAALNAADQLVAAVYRLTSAMPAAERHGLQTRIRRAAVSVATNLVEGSARWGPATSRRFFRAAYGSARECDYLVGLAGRLRLIDAISADAVSDSYRTLAASLWGIIQPLQLPAGARSNELRRH